MTGRSSSSPSNTRSRVRVLLRGAEPAVLATIREAAGQQDLGVEVLPLESAPDLAVRRALDEASDEAILFVGSDPDELLIALEAGADEAVASDALSLESCTSALRRARARASGRRVHALRVLCGPSASQNELSEVVAWLAHRLSTPLATAMLDVELLERVLPKIGRACGMLLDREEEGGVLSPLELRHILPSSELASMADAEEVAAVLSTWTASVHAATRDMKSLSDLFRTGPPKLHDVHDVLEQSELLVARALFGGLGVVRKLSAESWIVLAPKTKLTRALLAPFTRAAHLAREAGVALQLATRSDETHLHIEWHVPGAPAAEDPDPVSFAVSAETARQLGGQTTVRQDEAGVTFELALPLAHAVSCQSATT